MTELKSWNNTAATQAIINFVAAVTNPAGAQYVPPAERIATFDNDGTLWCEKPGYIQLFFAIDRLKQMAEVDPALLEKPAYRAATAGDLGYFATLYPGNIPALMEIVFDTHAGMPQAEFEELAYSFLSQARHPRFDAPYKQCVYQPMLELLGYLRRHDFKVYIASAGGMSFVRTVSEEIYQIPRENVIGSNTTFEVTHQGERLVLLRKPGLIDPPDDGPGKPVNIELHIGRPPIMAVGNANGDAEMMEFAQASGNPYLNLLLRHDDADREYAYTHGAERVVELAAARNWLTVSMKNDWRRIFPFDAVSK